MDTGLRLLTSFEFPALGSGVTLAIFQSFGISHKSKDKLKSSTTFVGTAKNASRNISLDKCSTPEDLFMVDSRKRGQFQISSHFLGKIKNVVRS